MLRPNNKIRWGVPVEFRVPPEATGATGALLALLCVLALLGGVLDLVNQEPADAAAGQSGALLPALKPPPAAPVSPTPTPAPEWPAGVLSVGVVDETGQPVRPAVVQSVGLASDPAWPVVAREDDARWAVPAPMPSPEPAAA